jgi:ribonucleoside-diphosphate reductase beta chain
MSALTEPNPNRYVLYPIQHPRVYEYYCKALKSIWVVNEVSLADDLTDWNALSEPERRALKHVLAFFAGSDGAVNENLVFNFYQEMQAPEVRAFYTVQIFIEGIHSEMYSLLISTYVQNPEEQREMFQSIQRMPCVAAKTIWAQKHMDRTCHTLAERIAAFAFVEGLMFSASFAVIFYFKNRGRMPGLCKSNDFIARDEGLHTEFACLLYSMFPESERMPLSKAWDMARDAVQVEKAFVRDAIQQSLVGLSAEEMCQYVEYCADLVLRLLGYAPAFHAANPFDFMEMISLDKKTNFFERRVSEYQMANVDTHQEFGVDADF